MDLFRVERYMGEDVDQENQQGESLRLTRLQLDIDNRKRKRNLEGKHVSSGNESKALDLQHRLSEVQGEGAEKAKKKKTKFASEGHKSKKKRSLNDDNDEATSKCPIMEVSDDYASLENESVEKRPKKNKVKGSKNNIKAKKLSTDSLITEALDDDIDIFVGSDSLSENSGEKNGNKRKEKKSKKKRNTTSTIKGVTAEDHVERKAEVSVDSEVKMVVEKETDIEREDVEHGEISLDIPQEKLAEDNKETGFTVIGGHKKVKEAKKVQRMLPKWIANPVIISSDFESAILPVEQIPYLDPFIINKLQKHDINHLFPVQSTVIPSILSQMENYSFFGRGGYQPSDICVSAPTGSGKTLAYVLPIIQSLLQRVVCHLRALVILPTKDLANQVKQVFEMFTEETKLKVGLASGSKSFLKDQEQLVNHGSVGGSSRVDILVCTPGRLVDHITSTPHFVLHHVRFLVIDEADRLLDQSYHGWLGKVLKAAYNKQYTAEGPISNDSSICCNLQTFRNPPGQQTVASFSTIQLPLQKLLFSATMTHSPEKLAPLQLYQPMSFTVMGNVNQRDQRVSPSVSTDPSGMSVRYSIPEGLTEYMTVCNSGEKPLAVLYFLTQLKFQRVLCFASSLEATHRLYLLVKLYGGVKVAEYSSSLTPQQRKAVLRDFRSGKVVQLLICSDAMARGMDIEDVLFVISYDVPNFIRSYIHRVGRTARAGNKGTAITLLHSEEVHHFRELIKKTGREKIPKYNIKDDKLQSMVDKYQETLERLQDAVKLESQKKSQPRGKQQITKLLQEQLMNNLEQKW